MTEKERQKRKNSLFAFWLSYMIGRDTFTLDDYHALLDRCGLDPSDRLLIEFHLKDVTDHQLQIIKQTHADLVARKRAGSRA